MASLPHGNIHPEYPALIFLPSPRNAKAWGRKILPWGRSIPSSQACYQLYRREGEDMAVLFALLKTPKLPLWAQGTKG